MSDAEMLKLADWIKHMHSQGSSLAHVPEMREHLQNLEKWERGVRAIVFAKQTPGA